MGGTRVGRTHHVVVQPGAVGGVDLVHQPHADRGELEVPRQERQLALDARFVVVVPLPPEAVAVRCRGGVLGPHPRLGVVEGVRRARHHGQRHQRREGEHLGLL